MLYHAGSTVALLQVRGMKYNNHKGQGAWPPLGFNPGRCPTGVRGDNALVGEEEMVFVTPH